MKTKKTFRILISFILVIFFMNLILDKSKPENIYNNNESINFSINVSKNIYLESEPIWIEHTVAINKEKIELDRKPDVYPSADIDLLLINSKNDTLKYIGGYGTFFAVYEYPDTLWGVLNLLNYFGYRENFQDSQLLRMFYLPEETYTLQIILTYYVNKQKKSSLSNKTSFSVVKPHNEEEIAHHEWLDIYSSIILNENYQNIVNKIDQFIENFNNSVYVERTKYLFFIRTFIDPNFENHTIEYLMNNINSNPNSYYNYFYLNILKDRLNKNLDFKNYLNSLNMNLENTLTNKIIYHEINGHIK